MLEHQKRVKEFMVKAGQSTPDKFTPLSPEQRLARGRLLLEETLETLEALGLAIEEDKTDNEFVVRINDRDPNWVEVIDGCCDISVVNIGLAISMGINIEPLLLEVDLNNLEKFGPGGYRDNYGKWVKPPNHPKPKIKELLNQQGANL